MSEREGGMLVTFHTKAHADITMFGDVAIDLLKLAGLSGAVPTAILADDIPAVLTQLERGLAERHEVPPEGTAPLVRGGDDPEAEPAVPLRRRAIPLIALLRDADAAGADVIVSATQ